MSVEAPDGVPVTFWNAVWVDGKVDFEKVVVTRYPQHIHVDWDGSVMYMEPYLSGKAIGARLGETKSEAFQLFCREIIEAIDKLAKQVSHYERIAERLIQASIVSLPSASGLIDAVKRLHGSIDRKDR